MKRIGLALSTILISIFAFPIMASAHNVTIQPGVTICGTDVAGMNADEVELFVKGSVDGAKNAVITVNCVDDKSATLAMSDIGIKWTNTDLAKKASQMGTRGNSIARYKARKDLRTNGAALRIEYEIDGGKLRQFVEDECLIFNNEAVNATFEKTEDGFNVIKGQTGVVIDEDKAVEFLRNYIINEWDGTSCEVTIPVTVDNPEEFEGDLDQITDLLGTFKTSYKTSSENRSCNVANGCRLVNGTTLYPGEEFSMYDHIKPFSEDNGYKLAGSYMNGMVVDSLGGGICQVSTTLYNAVLLAELEVTERNNHSMIVSYVPASADAAISESAGKDFRFVNNTEYPIYIEGYTTDDKQIVFNIYGKETRPSNRTVEYNSKVLETIPATTENIIPSSAYPVGYVSVQAAHTGYKAQLWKTVTVDGVEESKELVNQSTYNMVPRTAVVGIATANPQAAAQMAEAIGTGSIDYTKSVAAAWAAVAAAPAPTDVNP